LERQYSTPRLRPRGLNKYDENEPVETEADDRFSWCLADNIRPTLPDKMKIYYDRWRALQPA
jgi:hypothetical protein